MSKNDVILSPLDQLMPRSHIQVALVFSAEDHNIAVAKLTNALCHLCNGLPYLKGYVYEDPNPKARKQLAIQWSTSGSVSEIHIVPAPQDYPSFADLCAEGAPSSRFPFALFPQPEQVEATVDAQTVAGTAVLAVSLVKFQGGLVLCIAGHHNVMDGTAFGMLIKRWAYLCAHSEENLTRTRDCQQQRIQPDEPMTRRRKIMDLISTTRSLIGDDLDEDVLARHPEFALTSQAVAPSANASSAPGSSRIFRFSLRKLAASKDRLAKNLESRMLTINNILCAIIWSNVAHVRSVRSEASEAPETSKLVFATDARKTLGLADGNTEYAGNVNVYAQAEQPFDALSVRASTDNPGLLIPIITSIAQATHKISPTHIAELIHVVDCIPDVSDLGPGWNFYNGPDLSITSWANLGLCDADFGEGLDRPKIARIPCIPIDGLAVILPRQRGGNEEVIEVTMMLREDDMARLERSREWESWLQ